MRTLCRISCGFGVALVALAQLLSVAGAGEVSERRVALVIGNANYRTVPPLANPRNDAEDVAAALRADGFEVISRQDLDRRGMGEALGRFAREAETADVALFYYAGHGLQFRNENFLVPVDSAPADGFAIQYETTRVAEVIDALNHTKGVRLLILDACRNNPLADRIARSLQNRDIGVTRGLARITQSQGMVIAYATQANDVAADGQGRNSPFSAAFVEQLREPGLEIGQLFRRVAAIVNQRTNGQQTPELSLSLLGDFYFNRSETDLQAWAKLRQSSDLDALRAFLVRYPNSVLADAGRARLDLIERSRREEVLQKQIATYEDERRKAAEAAEAATRADAARQAREKAEREQLAAGQAAAKLQAERQQAEQERRLKERLALLEAENRKAQAELAARGAEQARRAKDDTERERQVADRDRLAAAQAERMKAGEAEAQRQKSEADRRIAERLAKLEEDNRTATAELAARSKAEEAMRASAERERGQLVAALEAERRKASEELQRVQREKGEAASRQQNAAEPAAQPPVSAQAGYSDVASEGDRVFALGVAAEERREFREAAAAFTRAADAGHVGAMLRLATLHTEASGLHDRDKARAWLERAASGGDPVAMFRMAKALEAAGGRADLVRAADLYRRAAEAGNTDAMNNFATLLGSGTGIARDDRAALGWYRRASNLGNTIAMYNMAAMMDDGRGTKKDATEAAALILKALRLRNVAVFAAVTGNGRAWSRDFGMALQRALTRDGLYRGAVDGRLGRPTTDALAAAMK